MKLNSSLPAILSLAGLVVACHPASCLTPGTTDPAPVTSQTTAPAEPKPLTARWLDLANLSNAERYRSDFGLGGTHNFENAQERSLIQGKLKLDAEGRYDIGFRASSGRYFNWAYSNFTNTGFIQRVTSAANLATFTPAEVAEVGQASIADPSGLAVLRNGLQSNGWEFYMRELYFSATPVKPVTVEFGSFGIERGLSSEITTFDDDGYLSGERIRFHDAGHLFFDEVAFTNAFFGDFATVNLFARGSSLENFNYRQVSAKKQLNAEIGFSGEYTWQVGTDTLREATVFGTQAAKAIDSVRLEVYERLNTVNLQGARIPGGSGFAVSAQKKLGNLSGDAGFATVDSDYTVYAGSRVFHAVGFTLNGDNYGLGNRPFVHAAYKVAPGVTAFGFYTHEVGSTRVLTLNQQGFNAGVNFDLKAMINKEKLVF